MSHIRTIARLEKDKYALTGEIEGEDHTIEVKVNDTELVDFATMLGFDKFYPDLEVHLAGIEHWTGILLLWGGS